MEDREKVIRRQVEATCGNEYHFYTEDVLHLLVIIDSLRASQKELVEAGEPIASAVENCSLADIEGVVDEHVIKHYSMKDIKMGDLRRLSQAIEKAKDASNG